MARKGASLELNTGRIRAIQRELRRLPPEVRDRADKVIERGLNKAANEARALAPVDLFELQQGIGVLRFKRNFALTSDAPYSAFVEWGVKRRGRARRIPPGLEQFAAQFIGAKISRQDADTPLKRVRKWAKRKGLKNPHMTAKTILREGTTPHPFFTTPYLRARDRITDNLRGLLTRVYKKRKKGK